ncbi:MAG: helix-turn-helix domain-containing protein [Acidimicrobiales bacterium]
MEPTQQNGHDHTRQVDEPLVLDIPSAARLLGISRALAYELAARGELPVLRLGRRLVVPRKALYEFVEGVNRDSADR